MSEESRYWNEVFRRLEGKWTSTSGSWLERWEPVFRRNGVNRVLEIGFGGGNDTRYLMKQGYTVTATDFSEEALIAAKPTLSGAELLLHDTRQPFPFESGTFDLCAAGLSLHYFGAEELADITGEIRRLLRPGGLLALRVNSVRDPSSVVAHPIPRYFFSPDSCREMLPGWEELELSELAEGYYGKPKIMIEGLFRKPLEAPEWKVSP